jgi:hypothetical protein
MAATLEERVRELEQQSEAFEVILRGVELLCADDDETKAKFVKAMHSAMAGKPYDPLQVRVKKILPSLK